MIVKIPGRELALARKGGAEHTLIDFVYEVKDDYGAPQMNLRDKIDVKLSGSTRMGIDQETCRVRHGSHAVTWQVFAEVPGARCRDWPDWHLHDELRDTQPQQRGQAGSDQFSRP